MAHMFAKDNTKYKSQIRCRKMFASPLTKNENKIVSAIAEHFPKDRMYAVCRYLSYKQIELVAVQRFNAQLLTFIDNSSKNKYKTDYKVHRLNNPTKWARYWYTYRSGSIKQLW